MKDSQWTHSICDDCWKQREPNREPVRITDTDPEPCCFCGQEHQSGIYVRVNYTDAEHCQYKPA
jgi:hypothetical protein